MGDIKDAFDAFVDDRYTEAEDIIRGIVRKSVNDHFKTTLELENDVLDLDTEESSEED